MTQSHYLGALLANLTADVRTEEDGTARKTKYKALRQALEGHKWGSMSEGTNIN